MMPEPMADFQTRIWPGSAGEKPLQTQERRAAMRAVLNRFVRGDATLLNRELKDLGSMKSDPRFRGYWEFRSQGRMEETRLFGFFARPGAFVATAFKGRGEFGGADDPKWLEQCRSCNARWQTLTAGAAYMDGPWPVLLRSDLKTYTDHSDGR